MQDDPLLLSVLPVALPLRGRRVLVIGGGHEAEQKAQMLLTRGAHVTVVAKDVASRLAELARRRRITWFARDFLPYDVAGAYLVMLTEIDAQLGAELAALRRAARFWLCALDQPAFSDVYMVSTVQRGPVQLGISTGGSAPLLARRLREALERGLDQRFGRFATGLASLRASLRKHAKEERMQALDRALNGFAMEVRVSYPGEEGPSGLSEGNQGAAGRSLESKP